MDQYTECSVGEDQAHTDRPLHVYFNHRSPKSGLLAKASVSHAVHSASTPISCSCMVVDDCSTIFIGNCDMRAQSAWRLASLFGGRQIGLRSPNQSQIARLLLPGHSKLLMSGVEPHVHNVRVSVPSRKPG